MASVSGSRLTFFSAGNNGVNNNIVLTATGATVGPTVAGKFNIEVFTSTAGALAAGFDAGAFIQGAVTVAGGGIQAGTLASTEQLLGGSFGVIDATGNESIQIVGNALTTVAGGSSSITVVGSSGDTITGSTVASNTQLIDATGSVNPLTKSGPMTVFGGAGNTTVWGGTKDNITGGGGVMIVDGSRGGNTITGGAGGMIVTGATSTVAGTAGNKMIGGAGDAIIFSGAGDTVQGGNGNLTVSVLGKNDSITGSQGGTTFINDLFGVGGGSKIVGGTGASNLTVGGADQGANTMIFAAAGDLVTVGGGLTFVDASQGAITVQGGDSTVNGAPLGAAGFNTNILAGKGDSITLGAAKTYINALAGGVTVAGGAGFAHIDAGGAAAIQGGAGVVEVDGATGGTTVTGGPGSVIVFALGKGSQIAGSQGNGTTFVNEAYGTISGSSKITGGNGTVTGAGGLGVNTFIIGAAGDTIFGGSGTMSVNGISGGESIFVTGGNATVQGGTADTITGAGTGTLQAFLDSNDGTELVNLAPGHGKASLRDISVSGAPGTKITVTGFAAATDVIQSKTSVDATNTFLGTSASDGAGGTLLTFKDGSTMTLALVAPATVLTFAQ